MTDDRRTLASRMEEIIAEHCIDFHGCSGPAPGSEYVADRILALLTEGGEPVAWMVTFDDEEPEDATLHNTLEDAEREAALACKWPGEVTPLFTHPSPVSTPERLRDAIAWLRGDDENNEPFVGPRSRRAIDALLAYVEAFEPEREGVERYEKMLAANGEAGYVECHPDGSPEYQHFVTQAGPFQPGAQVVVLSGDEATEILALLRASSPTTKPETGGGT